MTLLLIIDVQNEFINENTKKAIEEISNLINQNKFDKVVFTKFLNDSKSPMHEKLKWDGCISEESRKVSIDTKNYPIIEKNTYSAYDKTLKDYIEENNIDKIYLCGIDVECCVLATAFSLFDNKYNVYILKDYCYSTYGEERKHSAIEILKRNIGKDYIV